MQNRKHQDATDTPSEAETRSHHEGEQKQNMGQGPISSDRCATRPRLENSRAGAHSKSSKMRHIDTSLTQARERSKRSLASHLSAVMAAAQSGTRGVNTWVCCVSRPFCSHDCFFGLAAVTGSLLRLCSGRWLIHLHHLQSLSWVIIF
jgi:hypothetical protein